MNEYHGKFQIGAKYHPLWNNILNKCRK